jgi:hypothetical protein
VGRLVSFRISYSSHQNLCILLALGVAQKGVEAESQQLRSAAEGLRPASVAPAPESMSVVTNSSEEALTFTRSVAKPGLAFILNCTYASFEV